MLDTTNLLWYSSVVVELLFCLYLIWIGLAKSFPVFTSFMALSVLASLGAIYFVHGASADRLPLSYTYYWLCVQPLLLVGQIAVALEVHSSLWKGHEPIVRQARSLIVFALLTALVAATLPIRVELKHAQASPLIPMMHFVILAKRYVSTVLVIFLLLSAVLFVIVVRDAFHSRQLLHEAMCAAYLGIYAVTAFIIEMEWGRNSAVNAYMAVAFTLCFVIWTSAFRPQDAPLE